MAASLLSVSFVRFVWKEKSSSKVPKFLKNTNTCALYGSCPPRHLKVGPSPLIMPVLVCVRAHLSPPVTPDVSACEVRPSSHADTCTGGPRPPGKDEGRGQRSKVRWPARSRLRLWTKGASVSEGRSFIIRCPAAGRRWRRNERASETRGTRSRCDGSSALFQTAQGQFAESG